MPEPSVVRIDPPEVEDEDLEDLLATDDLFIDYFNMFLALPTFPEPLCFNKNTGGFEVVSEAKRELAKQIKSAVRSAKRTPRIYRVTKNHSYSDIPLIPMEEDLEPEHKELETSFTVKTLNKEQGIHWIKRERLPAFLESDCYMEYRLAKILTDVKTTGKKGEFCTVKIDYGRRPRKKRKRDITPPPEIDETEVMIKNMYVCMGNAPTTETDAWFTDAKMAHETEVTTATATRPISAAASSVRRPPSSFTRPMSALSVGESNRDSGIGTYGSPSKMGSIFSGSSYHVGSIQSIDDINEETDEKNGIESKLFSGETGSKPHTPRPSDTVCIVVDDTSSMKSGGTVFYNKSSTKDEGVELDDVANGDIKIGEEIFPPTPPVEPVTFTNIDDIGCLVVGTVLKHTVAKLLNMNIKEVAQDPRIKNIFPYEKYEQYTMDHLEHVSFEPPEIKIQQKKAEEKAIDDNNNSDAKEKEAEKKTKSKVKDSGYDSGEDSVLGSDDDYEEFDTFFRKKKTRRFHLGNKKGMEEFKKFLVGTKGETYWNLWLDIDHGRLLPVDDHEEIQNYLAAMRERYAKHGAELEVPREVKKSLGLGEPANWTLAKLFTIHNKVAEPLITYWAPRFLLRQTMKVNPSKNDMYHHQSLIRPKEIGVYPDPPTATLLPLRPKSCRPRIGQVPPLGQMVKPAITSATQKRPQLLKDLPLTTPPVGLRRVHSVPPNFLPMEFQRFIDPELARKDEEAKKEKLKKERQKKEMITPTLVIDSASQTKSPRAPSEFGSEYSRSSSPVATPRSFRQRIKSATSERSYRSDASSPPPGSAKPPTRPKSAGSVRKEGSEKSSEVSEFQGGCRMEGLLQALNSEKKAGQFLRRYIEKSGNDLWCNCILFWKELQSYHFLFYSDLIDPFGLAKKAQSINALFIVEAAPYSIECNKEIRNIVKKHIDPPYEELFDDAEVYTLEVLYEAWVQLNSTDSATYEKIELIEEKRQLEAKSKYVIHLQKRGLIRETIADEDPLEGYQDPVYDETLVEKIPEEFREFTLEKLVHNRLELEEFRHFLSENYASTDLTCWMEIEAFRRSPHDDVRRRDMKAKDIKNKFLNKKYFFGPNSPAGREGQTKVMEAGGGWGKLLEDRPPNEVILEAQKYVQERLEKKWLPLFLATEDFADRQRPTSSMSDVVDDVMMQRRKRTQAVWKMMESKWVSSSKDIISFRKALLNPVTCLQFRKFVSMKNPGELYENDVLFWLEVQKYKDMYHAHSDEQLIQQKITTIINCFIDSQVPPSLQIDIPAEQAERILERRRELGPYIFREAQLMVFRMLFSHWTDFQQYRSNYAEEKILPTLIRQQRRAKALHRQRQKQLEEKMEREAARRRALGLPVAGEEDANADMLGEEEETGQDTQRSRKDDDENGSEIMPDSDKVQWTYSQYMAAINREEVLNNTDESTFSSLADGASVDGSVLETRKPTKGEMGSRPNSARGSRKPSVPSNLRNGNGKISKEKVKLVNGHTDISKHKAKVIPPIGGNK